MCQNNTMKNIFRPLLYLAITGCVILPAACQSKKNVVSVSPGNKTHVYFVSPGGSESNPGTIDAPFLLINTAVSKALPGDTIFLREGNYQQKVMVAVSGTAEKQIVITAYKNERPVLDGSGLSISGSEAMVTIHNAGFIVMDGLDI